MILSASEIRKRLMLDIVIQPYSEKQLNPNSYNLTLGDKMLVYSDDIVLDPKMENPYLEFFIPKDGYILEPGELYLAQTAEYTETHNLVPMIEGRSSFGRLGLYIHVTAGFGDVGFCGHWTLELSVVRSLKIYPGMQVAQIYYHTLEGEAEPYCSNKYQHNKGVQPSLLWKEYQ